jgi:hypothetical protein
MALTLDATVGGVSANAYLTQVAAQALLDGVPNADAWTNASATGGGAREQALVYATQLLDAIAYKGIKTNAAQALLWPRGGVLDPDYGDGSDAFSGYILSGGGQFGYYLDMAILPARILRATTMLALEILRAGTSDIWGVDATANIAKKDIGGAIATEYIDVRYRRFGLRVYPSVWREIFPLTLAANAMTVERA